MVYDTTNFKLVNIFLLNFERKKRFFTDGDTLSLSPYIAFTQRKACMLSPASGQWVKVQIISQSRTIAELFLILW